MDDRDARKPRPVMGDFGLGLSYGLPVGVTVAGLLAWLEDDPDATYLGWIGIVVAVAVALLVMALAKPRSTR